VTSLRLPGDKSIAHRAIILAPLAAGDSWIRNLPEGGDVGSTVAAMRSLGARIHDEGDATVRVEGGHSLNAPSGRIDCGNSGTTARLLAGLLTGLGLPAELDGDESLRRRPMDRVVYPLQAMGGRIRYLREQARLPLLCERRASGSLRPLRHRGRHASAQVKSALLLAGLAGRTAVQVLEPVRSRDHTERLLGSMGASIGTEENEGVVHTTFEPEVGPGKLRALELDLPGDLSSAAFLIVAALLHGRSLTLEGIGLNPTRTAFLEVLRDMGAAITDTPVGVSAGEPWGRVTVEPSELEPLRISGATAIRVIDEIPALAMLATRIDGVSEVSGAGELRVKESDRIAMIARNLSGLGVDCREAEDGFRIRGSPRYLSGRVLTGGDHRLTMAFGVLGSLEGMQLEIERPESVRVSFPAFWDRLEALVDPLAGVSYGRGSPPDQRGAKR
jgi:3-phosphoshikimate 1-carboxyvinyltransferase